MLHTWRNKKTNSVRNFVRRYYERQSVARGIMEICFDVQIEISFLGIPTSDRFCYLINIPGHVGQVHYVVNYTSICKRIKGWSGNHNMKQSTIKISLGARKILNKTFTYKPLSAKMFPQTPIWSELGSNLSRDIGCPDWGSSLLLQSLHENDRIVSLVPHDHFLTNPFQFINRPTIPSYRPKIEILTTS
jgi:hypothetical protein